MALLWTPTQKQNREEGGDPTTHSVGWEGTPRLHAAHLILQVEVGTALAVLLRPS